MSCADGPESREPPMGPVSHRSTSIYKPCILLVDSLMPLFRCAARSGRPTRRRRDTGRCGRDSFAEREARRPSVLHVRRRPPSSTRGGRPVTVGRLPHGARPRGYHRRFPRKRTAASPHSSQITCGVLMKMATYQRYM